MPDGDASTILPCTKIWKPSPGNPVPRPSKAFPPPPPLLAVKAAFGARLSMRGEEKRNATKGERKVEEKAPPLYLLPFSPDFKHAMDRRRKPTMKEGGPRSVERRRLQRPNQTRPLLLRKLSKPELGRGAGVEGNEGGCFLDHPFFLMGLPSHLDPCPKFREYLFFEWYLYVFLDSGGNQRSARSAGEILV